MLDKIKDIVRDDAVFYGLLIVLVGVTAYGLGLQATKTPDSQTAAVSFSYAEPLMATSSPSVQSAQDERLVASKNGTKYHFMWCPGAGQIKEENKLYFNTKEAARAAGYTPAANCPGLK